MTTRKLYIKNRTYYFYNDLIDLSNFEAINLNLDKKNWKDIDIYYIGYIDKEKPSDWEVNSANPLYLIINKVFCFVEEKKGVKYLSIDRSEVLNKLNQVFNGLKCNIEKITGEKVNYDSEFYKIKFITEDSLPLGKLIYFPTLTVVIRCVFGQNGIYHPQVYLDDAL